MKQINVTLVGESLKLSTIKSNIFFSPIKHPLRSLLTFQTSDWRNPSVRLHYRATLCVARSCDRNSVCLSVTLVDCVHMVRSTIMISSPCGSPIILVSGDITFIPKFEGDHPERGCWMRVEWVRIGDFRPISRRISETVRDSTKVTIDH